MINNKSEYKIYTYTDLAFALALNNNFKADIVVNRNGTNFDLKNVEFKTREDENGKKIIERDFYVQPIEKNFFTFFSQTFKEIGSHIRIAYVSLFKLIRGEFGLNTVSGPVGIAAVISNAAAEGLEVNFLHALNNIITIMMVISISLGVMNLLPFPALDGGRLIFLIIEAVTKKKVNPKYEEMIHKSGLIILMFFAVIIAFSDIYKLFAKSG